VTPSSGDAERRKIFRRIEWVFVYAPPILAVVFACFGAAFLAFFIPLPGTTFWGRWAIAILVILVIPAVVYFLRSHFWDED
jgi:hypothetical protein